MREIDLRAHRGGPVDQLTPSELLVCEEVAAGATNREIAENLYVTVKAVEFHIHNAFLKFDVNNRTQLALAYLAVRESEEQSVG